MRFSTATATAALAGCFLFLATTAFGIPVSSDGSLGALNVTSGTVVFNTDFSDEINGGTYAINGVMQAGTAREVTLPQDSGGVVHAPATIFVFDFTGITLGTSVDVSVAGASGLVLLASDTANISARFNLSGSNGQEGGNDAGGGGGAGGGVLSIFSEGDLTFTGVALLNGGGGGLSYQMGGSSFGGSGGVGSAGGGSGGDGGFGESGGRGGNGGEGGLIGIKFKGIGGGIRISGGGGGGGGAYRGGSGGGADSNGSAGNPGGLGLCDQASAGGTGGEGGGAGGDGGLGGLQGTNTTPNGEKGENGGIPLLLLTGGGGGGGGGAAPDGGVGGAGGTGGLGGGGGGGGGGGDLCVTGAGQSGPLANGGGGGGGGGAGGVGNVITASQVSGGGGGGGQLFLGTNAGTLACDGLIEALGGVGFGGIGGLGALTLVAPDVADVLIQSNCLFNGVTPLSPTSDATLLSTLSLTDFLPIGGGGGGGAGGPGLPVPEPNAVLLLFTGSLGLAVQRLRQRTGLSRR